MLLGDLEPSLNLKPCEQRKVKTNMEVSLSWLVYVSEENIDVKAVKAGDGGN